MSKNKETIDKLLGLYTHATGRGNMKVMGRLVPDIVEALVAYIEELHAELALVRALPENPMPKVSVNGETLGPFDIARYYQTLEEQSPTANGTCEPCSPGGQVFETVTALAPTANVDDIAFFENKYAQAKKRKGKNSPEAAKALAQLNALKEAAGIAIAAEVTTAPAPKAKKASKRS